MHFEIYQNVDGKEYYWRLIADNNQPLAVCSQAYVSQAGALYSINQIRHNSGQLPIYDNNAHHWLSEQESQPQR